MSQPGEPRSLAEQEVFEKMCEGKEKFPSESAARQALKIYRKERMLRNTSGLVPYRCGFGEEHWHLGH